MSGLVCLARPASAARPSLFALRSLVRRFESCRGHSIVEVQTWYQRNGFTGAEAAGVGGGVVGPGLGAAVHVGVEQYREGPGQVGADLVVLVEVELGEERLVAQPAGLVAAALVDAGGVTEQVEAVLQLGAGLRRSRRGRPRSESRCALARRRCGPACA